MSIFFFVVYLILLYVYLELRTGDFIHAVKKSPDQVLVCVIVITHFTIIQPLLTGN